MAGRIKYTPLYGAPKEKYLLVTTLLIVLAVFFLLYVALTLAICFAKDDSASERCAVTLDEYFQNDMVLQREPAINVLWGVCINSKTVSISLKNSTYDYSAIVPVASNYSWRANLPLLSASNNTLRLVVKCASCVNIVEGILVGELWFAIGQSNMAWDLEESAFENERSQVVLYPQIRFFVSSSEGMYGWLNAQREICNYYVHWCYFRLFRSCSPAHHKYSALMWAFAKRRFNETGVPIGVIQTAVGGTYIHAWVPSTSECVTSFPQGTLWTTQVAPYTNVPVSGYLWYQGESDAWYPVGDNTEEYYTCSIRDLLSSLRGAWNSPNNTFIQFTLAPSIYVKDVVEVRDAQVSIQNETNVYFVSVSDYGYIPDWVHPPFKLELGERAIDVLNYYRDNPGKQTIGPLPTNASVYENNITIVFDENVRYIEPDLQYCTGYNGQVCVGWIITDADDQELNISSVSSSNNRVVITLTAADNVTRVSYNKAAWPIVSLYSDIQPVFPFEIIV